MAAPHLDQLQEPLGELLAGLLLDAQTADDGYDPAPLLSGFGEVLAQMWQLDRAAAPNRAVRASRLGDMACTLLEQLAARLSTRQLDGERVLGALHTDFAMWIEQHGGHCQRLAALISFHADTFTTETSVSRPRFPGHTSTLH